MADTLIIRNGQNLLDLAIQAAGSMEKLIELAIANGLSITEELVIGSSVIPVSAANIDVLQYYQVNRIIPATSTPSDGIGIGKMVVGLTFIVGGAGVGVAIGFARIGIDFKVS